jgi:hypothetical protein
VRHGQQLAVAVGELGDLGGQLHERVPVRLEQVVPGGGGVRGERLQRRPGLEAQLERDGVGLDGAAELGVADLVQDGLDLPGGVREPARASAGEHELLLLELEQQQLEQTALGPQDVGQLAQGHRREPPFRAGGCVAGPAGGSPGGTSVLSGRGGRT